MGTHLGQLPLLVSLDPKAWDGGCREAGTVGEPTQAADLGHGPWSLHGGHPGQLHLSLLVCRRSKVGLRETDSDLLESSCLARSWTSPSLRINPFPFYLDQSKLGVKSLPGLYLPFSSVHG